MPFWAERFLGIRVHPGQRRGFEVTIARTQSGWRAAYLTICLSAGNRAGKTLWLAILTLHSAFYKIGTRPPDPTNEKSLRSWLASDFQWYHFGIQQETAELVFHDIVRIRDGTHEAQKTRGCPLTDELGPEWVQTDKKWRGDYAWVVFHDELGGAQIQFRTTSEKAVGSLGKDMHGISFDECAFDPALEFVVDEILHLRRMGTGGPLVLVSTATEGMTAFADLWYRGDPDAPDRWPGTMSLRMSTRENIGYGLDEETFNRLVAQMPEYLIPQNIDGGFIEAKSSFFGSQSVDHAFKDDLPEHTPAQRKHRYAQGVDPALTYDSSWAITLDMTDPHHMVGVRAARKTGRQTVMSVSQMVVEGHRTYGPPHSYNTTLLDATGFGGKVFRDALADLHPLRAVEFGGTRTKKLRLLLDLKNALEKGWLILPRVGIWLAVRRQLLGYKLDDRKIEQDAVMALALAVREAVRNPANPSDGRFDFFGTTDGVPSTARRERTLGQIGVR